MDYSLREAAELLGIAPTTLRRWNERFDALLSESAHQAYTLGGNIAPRRYTEADIAILQQAKALIWRGLSYHQALQELSGNQSDESVDRPIAEPADPHTTISYLMPPPSTNQSAIEQPSGNGHKRGERAQHETAGQLDRLREYLEHRQVEHELSGVYPISWRERLTDRLFFQIAIVTAICVIAIFVAVGIAWVGNPRILVGAGEHAIASTTVVVSTATHTARSAGLASMPAQALTPATQSATPDTTADAIAIAASPLPMPSVAAPTAKTPAEPAAIIASPQPLLSTDPFPTASPLGAPIVPRIGPASAEAILLQVAEAEAALRTGQIEATIVYGARPRSSAQVRFDLGDEQHVPSFQITTTYEGDTSAQATERITIGDQAWERQQGSPWAAMPARESALKQLQAFLPRTDSIADLSQVTVERAIAEQTYVLHWYDTARDADIALLVDAAGQPQQLRRVSHANGLILTVTYTGWNSSVEIPRPQ
jgi:DNA-binding transcriptional MerR regulator